MAIPNGVIFIWTGTNASIPAGWQRVTDLDDRFPKGNTDGSTNPNVTGGASTHTHTSPAHSHTMNNHTHTIQFSNSTANGVGRFTAGNNIDIHYHADITSGNSSGGDLSSVTATYSSISNNPPYYDVIYITPTSYVGGIPNLSLGLSDDSSFTNNTGKYNGYYKCDGNNSTPDLTDKYLKGASAGANAGTTGGSLTNIHNLEHTHTVSSHTHASATSGGQIGSAEAGTNSGTGYAPFIHTHSVSLSATTATLVSGNPSLTTSETVEPAFKKLLAIQNRSGTIYTPVGIIGLWLGTIANIPTNFEIVSTMYDRHLKITNTNGDIGNTGGSNTHTHSSQAHTHTGNAHNHPSQNVTHPSTVARFDNNVRMMLASDFHTVTNTNTTATYANANTTADSSSNEPEFRTVAFIKYKGEKGGSFIFNLLR